MLQVYSRSSMVQRFVSVRYIGQTFSASYRKLVPTLIELGPKLLKQLPDYTNKL